MAKLKQWKVTIGGKAYYFEARTVKGAGNKARRLAAAMCKITEVK